MAAGIAVEVGSSVKVRNFARVRSSVKGESFVKAESSVVAGNSARMGRAVVLNSAVLVVVVLAHCSNLIAGFEVVVFRPIDTDCNCCRRWVDVLSAHYLEGSKLRLVV